MKKLLMLVALMLLPGCPKPPNPIPTPTPPEPPGPVVQYPELLLRQSGTLTRNGQPHLMFGAIPCWDPEEKDHGGWTGFSKEWVDYTVAKGANAFHLRIGPYVRDDRWPNGLQYQMGPYVNDDVAQGFNQAWWDRALAEVRYAESKGANVEVDLIDGWQCRHAIFGDVKSPWTRPDLVSCANTITPTHGAWLRKAVETFGCEAGVIWQDGNEIGVTSDDQGAYKPQWTFAMRDLVRQYEQEVGCGVVHMFGTNSGNETTEKDPRIDYSSTHNSGLVRGPHFGKFRQCNEHNPPFSPEGERMAYCAARNGGQAWWYWRGAQTQADMEKTLSLFSQSCEGVPTEGCPFAVNKTHHLTCKRFGTHGGYPLWDCTPKDARNNPIWPEGDAELRSACEIKSMGGLPGFTVSPPLSIHHLAHGGMAFAIAGHGESAVGCSIPDSSRFVGCLDTSGEALIAEVP